MKLLSFDLEMNQPSGKIIQIGCHACDTETKQIIDSLSIFVNPEEKLNPYIIKLTEITQEEVDNGYNLLNAYILLSEFHKKYDLRTQPVVWGCGDAHTLKKQLLQLDANIFTKIPWIMGFREYDVKTIYQSYCIAMGLNTPSGLSKSMNKMGMTFKGKKHNARDDAENTWYLFLHMLTKFIK